MITGYLAHPTWLHRPSAGAKLSALAAVSLIASWVTDLAALGAGLVLVLLVYASLGSQAITRLVLLKPLVPLLVVLALLQGWFGSWEDAAAMATRIVLMVLLASLVTLTTPMNGMMDALRPLLEPLRRLGINPRAPALAIALLIRFVPVLLAAWQEREEAWRARTGRRPSIKLIPAFIAETLRMADAVAESLDARGFDVLCRRNDAAGEPR